MGERPSPADHRRGHRLHHRDGQDPPGEARTGPSPAGASANSPPTWPTTQSARSRSAGNGCGSCCTNTRSPSSALGPGRSPRTQIRTPSWTGWSRSPPSTSTGASPSTNSDRYRSARPSAVPGRRKAIPTGCRRPTTAPTCIRYFHGCYSLGDDLLWGVTHRRIGGDHWPPSVANALASAARKASAGADAHSQPQPDNNQTGKPSRSPHQREFPRAARACAWHPGRLRPTSWTIAFGNQSMPLRRSSMAQASFWPL